LISVIIPLVDIKNIVMGTTAMFTSYSAVPKITPVVGPQSKANAIMIFDVYEHVHNIFSVTNPNAVTQILALRVEESRKVGITNFIASPEALTQVVSSSWKEQRPDQKSVDILKRAARAPMPLPEDETSSTETPANPAPESLQRSSSNVPASTASPVPNLASPAPEALQRNSSGVPPETIASPRRPAQEPGPNPFSSQPGVERSMTNPFRKKPLPIPGEKADRPETQ